MTLLETYQAAFAAGIAGDWAGSEALYRAVVTADETQIEAWSAMARCISEQGRYAEAIEANRRALAMEPRDAQKLCLMAGLCAFDGRLDDALYYYDLTLRYAPDHALAHWNRALWLLQHGRYAEGWAAYEWGKVYKMRPYRSLRPEWTGEAIVGKTLLVWAEQGVGDTIQFARFLKAVKERSGARVIFECQEELIPLLRDIPGADLVVRPASDGFLSVPADEHISLVSVPYALGLNDEAAFWSGEYLGADGTQSARKKKLAVGFCWKGNPAHANDKNRSMPFETMAPLLVTPGIEAYSLVPGEQFEPTAMDLKDWSTTAARIASLDVLVTVDTAVAHLAGAMGRQVLLLLPTHGDWRWNLNHETTTPWYPSITVLRQSAAGDWSGPINRAAGLLRIGAGI